MTAHVRVRTGYMKFVLVGDTDSSLMVHVARPDGYAACGTIPTSPTRGPGWWWDEQAGVWKQAVPMPCQGPVTCTKNGCLG